MGTDETADVVIDLDEGSAPTTAAPTAAPIDIDEGAEAILPKGAELNPDGSVTVRLLYPRSVTVKSGAGGVKVEAFEALTFHRLTGADLSAIRTTAAEHQQRVLFTRSSRVRSAVMGVLYDKLDAKDIVRCGRVLETFL
jgi:hypothetical protein